MVTLFSIVVDFLLKAVRIGAKIATNRATFIVTFVGGIAFAVSSIYYSLTSESSVLFNALSQIQGVNLDIAHWMQNSTYVNMIGYAMSIDVLLDGLITCLIFSLCTVMSAVVSAFFGVIVSVTPLFVDLLVSGIKNQFAKAVK